MKEDSLQIYLAGKMSGLSYEDMNDWRLQITRDLESNIFTTHVKTINPVSYFNFEEKRYQNELEIMKFDLSKVKSSDLVVVNLDGLHTSVGTMIECYEAYKNDIPVLAFGCKKDYESLHPWIKCCITRYDNYDDCIEYIRDFYGR